MVTLRPFVVGLALGLAATVPAGAAEPVAAPDAKTALVLLRTALLALNDANRTGNYTVLRDLGAPKFRSANAAGRLAAVFAPHRQAHLDLAAVAVLDPVWQAPPALEPTGDLRLVGVFPSAQVDMRYDLRFQWVDAAWRMSGLSVALAPSASVAPLADLALRR